MKTSNSVHESLTETLGSPRWRADMMECPPTWTARMNYQGATGHYRIPSAWTFGKTSMHISQKNTIVLNGGDHNGNYPSCKQSFSKIVRLPNSGSEPFPSRDACGQYGRREGNGLRSWHGSAPAEKLLIFTQIVCSFWMAGGGLVDRNYGGI